ncbi:MAG: RHS repeat-associated core domain-containing protein [Anaerolineaceae bacterium]
MCEPTAKQRGKGEESNDRPNRTYGINSGRWGSSHPKAVRIALRADEAITWLLSDHLSSTTVTVDATGNAISMLKYNAYGELRTGVSTTDYQYTGQRNELEIGLYFYVSRFYDPQLARFISADTIIPEPNSIKGYDRYAYVNGNPINYTDPSGHVYCDTADGSCTGGGGGSGNNGGGSRVVPPINDNLERKIKGSTPPFQESVEVTFQLLPVFDDFYYFRTIDESYSGFLCSGESNNGFSNLGNAIGLMNDALYGIRPYYYKHTLPFDQIVQLQIDTRYTDIPSINAKKEKFLSGLTIKNNSHIPYTVHYFIKIETSISSYEFIDSAGPGGTISANFNPLTISLDGIKVQVSALTGCIGPCIRSKHNIEYKGSTKFSIHPDYIDLSR